MSKGQKFTTRYTYCQLFDTDLVLVISDWKDFLEATRTFLSKDNLKIVEDGVKQRGENPSPRGFWVGFTGGGSIMWIRNKKDLGTLVHELTHAVHYLLQCKNIPLSEDTEEVFAYLNQFLFNSFTKETK